MFTSISCVPVIGSQQMYVQPSILSNFWEIKKKMSKAGVGKLFP
jgi:hypothetical protein